MKKFLLVLFSLSMLIYSNESEIIPSVSSTSDNFGYFRASAIDGNYAIVGAYSDDPNGIADAGSVAIFKKVGSGWIEDTILVASNAFDNLWFGGSVAIDGDRIIVGAAPLIGDSAGYAYIYKLNGDIWEEQALLVPDSGKKGDKFGSCVDIDGAYAIVGASGESYNNGSLRIYKNNGSTWELYNKIYDIKHSYIGNDLNISGDYIVAKEMDSIYVYKNSGTAFEEYQAIRLSTNRGAWACDIDNNSLVITTVNSDTNGVLYLFKNTGTSWDSIAEITCSTANNNFSSRRGLSILGDSILVGASEDDIQSYDGGAAYLYLISGDTLMLDSIFVGSGVSSNDKFGASVCLDSGQFIVGAKGIGSGGGAYIYGSAVIDTTDTTSGSDTTIATLDTNIITVGDNFASLKNNTPLDAFYKYSWGQSIYLPNDLGGEFSFSKIALHVGVAYSGGYIFKNCKIYVGHTTDSMFSDPNNIFTNGTLMYSGDIAISGDTGWQEIPLTSIFNYNGKDKLIISIQHSTGTYGDNIDLWDFEDVSTSRFAYATSDSELESLSDNNLNKIMSIQFFISDSTDTTGSNDTTVSGSVDSILIGIGLAGVSSKYPLDPYWEYSWGQYIYESTEVGEEKLISEISLHRKSQYFGTYTFTNCKIRMGNTSVENFSTDSARYTDDYLVYSGNITVNNDTGWQKIILDTPFQYNGTDNLIVLISQESGNEDKMRNPWSHYTVSTNREAYAYGMFSLDSLADGISKNVLLLGLYSKPSSDVSEINTKIITEVIMTQNTPNPFNPSTSLNFSLPMEAMVNLSIYDSKGRLVEVLSESVKKAGSYNMIWNANSFASGIYFAKLRVGNTKTIIMKMLLLK